MRVEYQLNYHQHTNFNGKDGYIIKGKTFENKEDLKKFIKEKLKKEDVITSIFKRTIQRLNLINLEEMK